MSTVLFWFRNDLRLGDNAALHLACAFDFKVSKARIATNESQLRTIRMRSVIQARGSAVEDFIAETPTRDIEKR